MKKLALSQGKVALVDDKDFVRASPFNWFAVKQGGNTYARRNILKSDGRPTTELLHNFLMGVKGLDHEDGDGLNNQRKNLRAATKRQNGRARRRKPANSSSQYRGVSWHSEHGKWTAGIRVDGRRVSLGDFEGEIEAAQAYDKAAREQFRDFAAPNFV